MRKIGYCRVSRIDQDLTRQIDALKNAGCDVIYADKISGTKRSRPELDKMLASVVPGDCIIVQKLDRFGRSIVDLLTKVEKLRDRKIDFKSLTDNFDTATSNGRLMLNMLASFAEYEREMIRERTKDALKSAKNRGITLGRPKTSISQVSRLKELIIQKKGPEKIMEEMGIKKTRYYGLLAAVSETIAN